jgi:hypothetical protein
VALRRLRTAQQIGNEVLAEMLSRHAAYVRDPDYRRLREERLRAHSATMSVRSFLFAIASLALVTGCSPQPQHVPSRIVQPNEAQPFPTTQPGDADHATLAAVTTRDTRIVALSQSDLLLVECIVPSSSEFGPTDYINGQAATIPKGELVHVIPDPAQQVDVEPGTSLPGGTRIDVVTDDGHEGVICGQNVIFVTPPTPAPSAQ